MALDDSLGRIRVPDDGHLPMSEAGYRARRALVKRAWLTARLRPALSPVLRLLSADRKSVV